jgi:hypothetical protein
MTPSAKALVKSTVIQTKSLKMPPSCSVIQFFQATFLKTIASNWNQEFVTSAKALQTKFLFPTVAPSVFLAKRPR